MKMFLFLIVCAISLWFCNTKAEQQRKNIKNATFTTVDTIYFTTRIQPVLQKKCSPCHFPGGKMYTKLPFDKAETIINHEAGALKRFKNEEELILIRQFIEQNKTAK